MKLALVNGQLTPATAYAPAMATCPGCGGQVKLRNRQGTYFWRHVELPLSGCHPSTTEQIAKVSVTDIQATALSDIEEEVILLKAVKELIDSMVNFEVLDLQVGDPESNILFRSITHQRFFNIILVDFLSRTDKKAFVKQTSYLGALKEISKNPNFDVDGSVTSLSEATSEFVDWLEQEVEVQTWLPSIDTETTLRLSRITFLKMCGNISKHNFLRAIGVATELRKALSESGMSIELDDALLALADFYERFHTDILNYHGSMIAEFLNNIRWGIYEYLQPEFQRSIVWESSSPPKYRYTYPKGVTTQLAKECYWEIMNEVRTPPYVRRFQVTKWLKLRY